LGYPNRVDFTMITSNAIVLYLVRLHRHNILYSYVRRLISFFMFFFFLVFIVNTGSHILDTLRRLLRRDNKPVKNNKTKIVFPCVTVHRWFATVRFIIRTASFVHVRNVYVHVYRIQIKRRFAYLVTVNRTAEQTRMNNSFANTRVKQYFYSFGFWNVLNLTLSKLVSLNF